MAEVKLEQLSKDIFDTGRLAGLPPQFLKNIHAFPDGSFVKSDIADLLRDLIQEISNFTDGLMEK